MSKKTTNKAAAEAVVEEVVEEAKAEATTVETPQESSQPRAVMYPFEDFYAHPESIGSTKDIVWAAFHYNGIVGAATKEEAMRMVKEFAERKVNS